MMKGIVIPILVLLAVAHLMVQQGEAVVSCGQVDSTKRGNLDPACCTGAQNIENLAQTTADKQAACECCKAAANRFPNVDEVTASTLPGKCGIEMNIPISMNTNLLINFSLFSWTSISLTWR
ncbi:non-specific lipid-transfer protein A-like [Pyrus x bretschneideri]|uniref:non-specific lipid-transfer protein A-like n=1 Tax=Pyrus x bretschneideri TaxID=225117 RepID=UPI002030BC6D|nr:non-specific lipid-transfer protein A-like [Pyrus x bretschneideri]